LEKTSFRSTISGIIKLQIHSYIKINTFFWWSCFYIYFN